MCLFDPEHGYYTTRVPIGASGDFTTAPEISQMFGEMLAAWWLATVRQNDVAHIHLVEIGPGRGALMADMLRTLERLDPALRPSLPVHMVEVSPRLTILQKEKLSSCGFSIEWHENLSTLPKAPLGIIANELFDAIPVKPIIKHQGHWYEHAVSRGEGEALRLTAQPISIDPAILPAGHEHQPDGAVFEYAPAREAFMANLADMLANEGGFGLFIDYGHAESAFGDTVQALKNHAYANPLEDAGEADLTSHVDFAALANIARQYGLSACKIIEQGAFLKSLGLQQRVERLFSSKPDQRETLVTAFERLTAIDQMGSLFKVLGISHPNMTLPALEKSS